MISVPVTVDVLVDRYAGAVGGAKTLARISGCLVK
jgi:hypothetical protein